MCTHQILILDALKMQKHWVDPTLGYCLKLSFSNQTSNHISDVSITFEKKQFDSSNDHKREQKNIYRLQQHRGIRIYMVMRDQREIR